MGELFWSFPIFIGSTPPNVLIIEEVGDFPWSIGIMEYWNDGLRERNNRSAPSNFSIHLSNTPLLQQIALMDKGVLDSIEETAGELAEHWG